MFILLNSDNGLHKIKLKPDLLSKQYGSWGGVGVERKLRLQPQGGSVELKEQVLWAWVGLGALALTIRLKPLL